MERSCDNYSSTNASFCQDIMTNKSCLKIDIKPILSTLLTQIRLWNIPLRLTGFIPHGRVPRYVRDTRQLYVKTPEDFRSVEYDRQTNRSVETRAHDKHGDSPEGCSGSGSNAPTEYLLEREFLQITQTPRSKPGSFRFYWGKAGGWGAGGGGFLAAISSGVSSRMEPSFSMMTGGAPALPIRHCSCQGL